MWMWRRMEKVRWKDKVTNDEVLRRVGEERRLIDTRKNGQEKEMDWTHIEA